MFSLLFILSVGSFLALPAFHRVLAALEQPPVQAAVVGLHVLCVRAQLAALHAVVYAAHAVRDVNGDLHGLISFPHALSGS